VHKKSCLAQTITLTGGTVVFRWTSGGHHPNFWRFLSVLQRQQSLSELEQTQLMAGEEAPPTRKRYKDNNERIVALVNDYTNRPKLEYLEGIAFNLKM